LNIACFAALDSINTTVDVHEYSNLILSGKNSSHCLPISRGVDTLHSLQLLAMNRIQELGKNPSTLVHSLLRMSSPEERDQFQMRKTSFISEKPSK
jgi:hypothetical protein